MFSVNLTPYPQPPPPQRTAVISPFAQHSNDLVPLSCYLTPPPPGFAFTQNLQKRCDSLPKTRPTSLFLPKLLSHPLETLATTPASLPLDGHGPHPPLYSVEFFDHFPTSPRFPAQRSFFASLLLSDTDLADCSGLRCETNRTYVPSQTFV